MPSPKIRAQMGESMTKHVKETCVYLPFVYLLMQKRKTNYDMVCLRPSKSKQPQSLLEWH